jgi:hypothetical protein
MVALASYRSSMRTPGHYQLRNLSRFKGAICAIFQSGAVPANPTTEITGAYIAGDETTVFDGFLVEVHTSGGVFKGYTRLRYGATQTATSLFIRELSRGEIAVANGDLLYVRREVRLSDKLVEATSDFNPDGIAVGTFNLNPPPVAYSGGHRVGRVDTGQTYLTVTHANVSYTVDPASGGTMTHLWTLPSGAGAFAPGSASTDAAPTIRYNVNADGWLIQHDVTDADNAQVTTEWVMVIVHDATHLPYECVAQPLEGSIDNGWGYSVQLFDDLTESEYPYGSYAFLWREGAMGGGQAFVGSPVAGTSHIIQIGVTRREETTSEAGYETLSFEIISPLARLAETPGFSKVMLREASPDAWSEIADLTVGRAVTQLILFYTNLVETGFGVVFHTDYVGNSRDYPLLFCNKDNPLGQIRELVRATKARFVCDRRGRFEVQPVMNLLDRTTRTSLTTILSIERDDLKGYTVSQEHWEAMEMVYVKGFAAHASDPAPVFAKAPGDAPGQGSQTENVEGLITQNATTLYAEAGLYWAMRNGVYVNSDLEKRFAPKSTLRLPLAYDAFDFYVGYILLPFSLRLRGVDLSEFRHEITGISISYENGDGEVVLELQAETFGEPGTDDTPAESNTGLFTDPSDLWGDMTFPTRIGGLTAGAANIGVLLTTGLYITSDFDVASPTWTSQTLTLDVSEVIHDGIQRPTESAVVECATSTKLRVYEAVTTTPAIRYSNAFTYAVQTGTKRSIQHERTTGNANWIPCVYFASARGIVYEGSIDGGATLQSPVDIGDTLTYSFSSNQGTFARNYAPLFVPPDQSGVAYTVARDGGSLYKLFKTSNFGASWAVSTDYIITDGTYGANLRMVAFIERAYQLTSTLWFGRHEVATSSNSVPIFKGTSASASLQLGTLASSGQLMYGHLVGAYAGAVGRRMFRPCDIDPNKFVVLSSVDSGFGGTNTNGINKVLDGATAQLVVPIASYPTTNWWTVAQIGADGHSVYLAGLTHTGGVNGVPVGYIANIDSATSVSDLSLKKGTGFAASGEALNLFGF